MGAPTWHFVPAQDDASIRPCDDRAVVQRVHAARYALLAVLVAGLVSSCSSSGPSDSDGISRAPTASTTPTHVPATSAAPTTSDMSSHASSDPSAQELEKMAVAAYLEMWSDFTTAGHTSDWQSPLLSQHATAYALQTLEKGLYLDHKDGVVTKGAPVLHPKVKSATPAAQPTLVLVSDCGDSSHWLKYVTETGKRASKGPGGRQAITAEVRRQPDGSWKVDQFAVEGVGSC